MNERTNIQSEQRQRSMRRQPASGGERLSLLPSLTPEARAPVPASALLSSLHDYFRYGEPGSTTDLEVFLHETGAGIHAEQLLDELAELATVIELHEQHTSGDAA